MKSPREVSQVVCLGPSARNKKGIGGGTGLSSWTINLQCSVAANTQRIFYALTVPEYIEAWICVPGCDPECRNVTCRVSQGFEIEHNCSLGARARISGTYVSFLKRKLSFSWQPAWAPLAHDSFVDIRLYGDFEKSILRLRHFGLESEEEFNWHLSLWSASVARLCKLFGDPAMTADQRRPRMNLKQSEFLCTL
jgi:uncharacterized protein YndB with AHSA1/START domain